MITVSKLLDVPKLIDGTNKDPLGALREIDAAIASRHGQIHERVLGFDYARREFMSREEFIVTVNPPEYPA